MSDIIEAAARAMWQAEWGTATWPPAEDPEGAESYRALARAAFPLIRAATLEEAAKVAEEHERRRERDIDGDAYIAACRDIAFDLRALKEQP